MLEAQQLFITTPLRNSERGKHFRNVKDYFNQSNLKSLEKDESRVQQIQQTYANVLVYGTSINIGQIQGLLQEFIQEFEGLEQGREDAEKVYLNQLRDIDLDVLTKNQFTVDARHLYAFNKEIYYQFIYYPAEMIVLFDHVLKDLYQKYYTEASTEDITRGNRGRKQDSLQTVINHLRDEEISCLKDFNAKSIGKLISMKGIVVKTSDIYPQMKNAHFKCSNCKFEKVVELSNARVQQPKDCEHCKWRDSFYIQHNLCQFTDKQYLKIQELPEDLMEGGIANSINLIAYDDHTDSVRPGDKILIVGIYRAKSIRVDSKSSTLKRLFSTYIDVVSFTLLQEKKCNISSRAIVFNEEDKRQFYKMAQSQTIIQDLISSFSPSIFGHQDIKKGILAQLFGGTKKDYLKGNFRSDINICLLGDPSTAKSQFLQQVNKISPRGIYTNGRGASAIGLTANVKKDPQTHEYILESGALILSDEGICCIDEFDKMNENSRTVLLQVMEQQTISIAKAGIVCQLNSRTSILAAANPLHSKYDKNKSIIQNINLPPTLLSRFDLIFIILDIPNKIGDQRIAGHILDLYSSKPKHVNKGKYSYDLLTKYITFAKQHIHPTISQEAGKKLIFEYKELRSKGQSRNIISATLRLLQSLIRISQSFAKMKLSNIVTENDVEEAVNLIKSATLLSATDPGTGVVDFGMLSSGISSAIAKKIDSLSILIKQTLLSNEKKYRKNTSAQTLLQDLKRIHKANMQEISIYEVVEALKKLSCEDLIATFGQDKNRPSFKLQKIIQQ